MSTLLNFSLDKRSLLNFKWPNTNNLWRLTLLLLLPCNVVLAGSIAVDDFESGSTQIVKYQSNGFKWRVGKETTVSTENPRAGAYSLKFKFLAKPDGKDSFSEQPFYLGKKYPELWIRYDLFVPANYNHRKQTGSSNNKFIYLWEGEYSDAFTGPGLSVQNWALDGGGSKAVPKAFNRGNFDKHYFSDGSQIFGDADRGKWITIIIHAKYATSSNDNGVFQLWKIRDGKRITVIDKTDGDWYLPGQVGFDQGYLLGWANSGFDQETIFYIDNIEFSTLPLLDGFTAAPKPPVFFQLSGN